MKIESLTKEQEKRMIEFRDKWIAIGTRTDPANRNEAERGIELAYQIANLRKPLIVWCGSPLSSGLARSIVLNFKEINSTSVWASVWASVRASVWASGYGQHDASWLGFYDYFSNVLKLEKQTEKLKGLWIISQSANWFIPYKNICWISERHNICRLKDGKIHCDGGPAIAYPDGFSIWALNGVRVPRSIAETEKDQLNPQLVIEEKNAEVRKEIVWKIGIERVLQKLEARTIEVENNYELIELPMNGKNLKYLKMQNPSTETFHIEGVPPEIKSIREALHFRKPEALQKIPIDDKGGEDWYQQGDLCVWPKDAKTVKSGPSILT